VYAASTSPGAAIEVGEHVQDARDEVAQPVALLECPFGVRLVGEEVAAVEPGGLGQAFARVLALARSGRVESDLGQLAERVGVDAHPRAIELIAAAARDEELRRRAVGAARLQAAAQRAHVMTHVARRLGARGRPQRVGDLLGVHGTPAAGDHELQQLPGALGQPAPAERRLAAAHLGRARTRCAPRRAGSDPAA
jgi:hypothetical protein